MCRHTYDEFKTNTACQEFDITVDPELNSLHTSTDQNSPVIDAGIDISEYFDFDKDGILRPQGYAWDIGAFEYTAGTNIYNNTCEDIILLNNFPNPFSTNALILYEVTRASFVTLALYNVPDKRSKRFVMDFINQIIIVYL